MRQRRVKDIEQKLHDLSAYLVDDPLTRPGRWKELWNDEKSELFLELGCGKGQFITQLAQQNPQRGYIGVEGHTSVILRALEKTQNHADEHIHSPVQYCRSFFAFIAIFCLCHLQSPLLLNKLH